MKLDRLFTNNMVLQRQKPIKIWGTYEGTAEVEVSFAGHTVKAERQGASWTAILPAMEAARNQTLRVNAGEEKLEAANVHVGEVWLAGGQSNMEFYMRYDCDYNDNLAECRNDDIRFFDQPETCYWEQEEDFDYSRMGFWRTCDPENLEYFSAVGYYFAVRIHRELGVPVGIIGCNKGGSTTQSWMSREALKRHGQVWMDDFEEEAAKINYEAYKEEVRHNPMMNWGNPFEDVHSERLLYGIDAEEQSRLLDELSKQPVPLIHYDNRPACYYDNMLQRIAPIAIRGVIWYQGESEVFHTECYGDLFSDLIDNWRELWKEELAFYCVQLAPFQNWMDSYGTDFPVIRQIQKEVTDRKQGVHLVSTSDVGMRYDIHPKKKQPVGTRLALSALKYEYHVPVQADAPEGVNVFAVKNDLHITFAGDMETLLVKGNQILELQMYGICHGEECEVSFDAEDYAINGNTLIIKNADMGGHRVRRVVFAGKDYYKVNLYGSHGIPAMPFSLNVTR